MITPQGGCLHGQSNRGSPASTTASVICRQESLQETGFHYQQLPHSWAGFGPSSQPVFRKDGRLQDGVSPAFLTLAPTLSNPLQIFSIDLLSSSTILSKLRLSSPLS